MGYSVRSGVPGKGLCSSPSVGHVMGPDSTQLLCGCPLGHGRRTAHQTAAAEIRPRPLQFSAALGRFVSWLSIPRSTFKFIEQSVRQPLAPFAYRSVGLRERFVPSVFRHPLVALPEMKAPPEIAGCGVRAAWGGAGDGRPVVFPAVHHCRGLLPPPWHRQSGHQGTPPPPPSFLRKACLTLFTTSPSIFSAFPWRPCQPDVGDGGS